MNVAALQDLRGQTVVVTGGSRGLGHAIAKAFALAGATVAITGRSSDAVQKAAASLGDNVHGFACDVADEASHRAFAQQVIDSHGPVDVLVNNAGINPWYRRAEDTSLDEWRSIIDVNLTGVFLGCQLFGRHMLERASGSIINISSVAAKTGLTRTAAYCAAKGGLEALTRSLAVEWATRGVRVNAVGPGYFETDLTAGLRDNKGIAGPVLGRTPMGRYGKPDELAGACLFLASPQASYITGQSLMVDGGWTAA